MTKTLPTITLDASSIELYQVWKVYFPYPDDAIRARLDGFGMRYEPELRSSVLPDEEGLPAKLRAAFENAAFVVVKNDKKAVAQNKPPDHWEQPPAPIAPIAQAPEAPPKPRLKASAMLHRGEARIKLETPYLPDYIRLLRTLEGATWSQTKCCWHLPKTKEAWAALNAIFEVEVDKGQAAVPGPVAKDVAEPTAEQPSNAETVPKISVIAHPTRTDVIGLRLPKEMKDEHLATVRNIHGRRWNESAMIWELPNTRLTMRFLEKYLKEHLHWTFQPEVDKLPERLDTAPLQQFLGKEGPPFCRQARKGKVGGGGGGAGAVPTFGEV